MDTTCQILAFFRIVLIPHDRSPQSYTRRYQIGQEVCAVIGVGKGDMVAVG